MKEKAHVTGNNEISEDAMHQIQEAIDKMFPTDILDTLDRSRPYNGQPWTDAGERGMQQVSGLTIRDIRDCFVRACYDSDPSQNYPKSIYDLDWENIDIMAVCQNMVCWIERYMGIFPNLPDSMKKGD